jgi:hypothetical protein
MPPHCLAAFYVTVTALANCIKAYDNLNFGSFQPRIDISPALEYAASYRRPGGETSCQSAGIGKTNLTT